MMILTLHYKFNLFTNAWAEVYLLCHHKISKFVLMSFKISLLLSDYVKVENCWTEFYQGSKGEGNTSTPCDASVFYLLYGLHFRFFV